MDFNTECAKGLFQQLFAENSVIVSSCETELTSTDRTCSRLSDGMYASLFAN